MPIVTGEEFIKAFSSQWYHDIVEQEGEIHKRFLQDSQWTYFMQPEGGFLNRLMNRLPGDLHYRTEYYTIDSLYVGGHDLLKKDDLSYPSKIYALIEHENQDKVEEEMWKLAYWRAPLKVIIFYDYSDKEKEVSPKKREWLPKKIKYLTEMLKTINNFYKENSETEYLFIIGAQKEVEGEIYWRWASNKSPQPTVFIGDL